TKPFSTASNPHEHTAWSNAGRSLARPSTPIAWDPPCTRSLRLGADSRSGEARGRSVWGTTGVPTPSKPRDAQSESVALHGPCGTETSCKSVVSWPREESNLRTQLRRLPLYPLSYGAEPAKGIQLRCRGSVAVAQLVELRVVVPVAAGSSPVRHPQPCDEAARRGPAAVPGQAGMRSPEK